MYFQMDKIDYLKNDMKLYEITTGEYSSKNLEKVRNEEYNS